MAANPIYITQAMTTLNCCNAGCGVAFGIPELLETELRRNHNSFYCPHGHGQHFQGESGVEKADRLRKEAEWKLQQKREECERERHEKIELRVRHFNLKQRIKRGKCPVMGCKERFASVNEHLKKHKRFK